MQVFFSNSECNRALLLAHARNDPKIAEKVPNYRIDKEHRDLEINYMGILSEMAVAKVLNVPLDTSIDLGGDKGYDLVWNGLKVDVKYSYHPGGRLFVFPGKPLLADVYVLVVGDEKKMNIVGWAKKEDFSHAKIRDFGYGPRLAIDQTELRDVQELVR